MKILPFCIHTHGQKCVSNLIVRTNVAVQQKNKLYCLYAGSLVRTLKHNIIIIFFVFCEKMRL